jgi:hypothetical protein
MTSSVTLSFCGVARTGELEALARDFGLRLQRLDERAISCGVTLSCDSSGQNSAPVYTAKIHLALRDAQIHADSARRDGAGHAGAQAALLEAYENARRQLSTLQRERCPSPFALALRPLE